MFIHTLIGLPDEAKTAIAAGVTTLVIWLIVLIASKTGLDFTAYEGAIISVVSGIIVTVLEKYLALIPAIYDNLVIAAIHVLVLALTGGAIFVLLFRRKSLRGLLAK